MNLDPKAVLTEAAKIIGERGAAYGGVEESFTAVAHVAQLIGIPVTPREVTLLLAIVKLVRMNGSPLNADHYIDLINYAAFAREFARAEGQLQPLADKLRGFDGVKDNELSAVRKLENS